MQIDQSVCLVTGASRGIGRALVDALLGRGAARVYAAARRPETLDDLAGRAPGRLVPLALDITDASQVAAAVAAAGDATLLINNAGVLASGGLLDSPVDAVGRDLEVNFLGTLRMVRAFAPVIESNGGGAIANLLSIVALAGMAGLGGYSAAKAAARSMTLSLRADLARRGIRVHAVLPGPVDTDMIRGIDMPKSPPDAVAAAILDGIEADADDILPDPMSRECHDLWRVDPKALERRFAEN